jgi:putative transposase
LEDIEVFLSDKNHQARESLEEAGEQLLSVAQLGIANSLHPSLLSTNAIENLFKNLRRHIGRVCRWREDSAQADRWLASGLILASEGFRKIKGYEDIPALMQALTNKYRQNQNRKGEAA